MLKESTSRVAGDFDAWDVVWQPLGDNVSVWIDEMKQIGPAADYAVQRLVGIEPARILGLDPAMPLSQKVYAVISFMQREALSLDKQAYGLRDYLMRLLDDSSGLPAAFPSPSSSAFPDTWITSNRINSVAVARSGLSWSKTTVSLVPQNCSP